MKHKFLRKLCNFQYWLGSNYSTLPTGANEMTERARKYTKELKANKSTSEKSGGRVCPNCKQTQFTYDNDRNDHWCGYCHTEWHA